MWKYAGQYLWLGSSILQKRGKKRLEHRDDECASKYEDDFSGRKVIRGRNINVDELDFGDSFDAQPVYDLKRVPHALDFRYKDAVRFLLDLDETQEIPSNIEAKGLPIFYRLIHLISTYNLPPRGSHRKVLTFMDIYIIEHLINHKPINLPYIMLRHIADAHKHKKNLPYGLIFTKIFTHFAIPKDMRELEIIAHIDPFNTRTLRKMGYKKNTNGEWIWRDDSGGDEGEEGDEDAAVPPSSSTHGETSKLYIDRQHSIDAHINTLELDLKSLRKEQ
ncbi:hypothetical protein CJ030_MR0G025677 [Morella rubra]|uniref:Uncharacterized protein n=1 Tax=Morella rubra TaxID=262757 RepID=A0A6A1UG78_9ROSI|nr:hypothetical protein CJ030_MR0G025677 [Morella rubra]